jgi:Histone methylation protein DOT1
MGPKPMMSALENLIEELEQDRSLDEPSRLRERIDALDRLDAYHVEEQSPTAAAGSIRAETYRRARAICDKLEASNFQLYQAIREEIQRGSRPDRLLQFLPKSGRAGDANALPNGEGYDYLDDLISGVLQFERPDDLRVPLAAEMVAYQPTPARHIFDLLTRTALNAGDVLIDLGSGLGHVPLLVSICTGARSIGIELEAAYIDCAQRSAQALSLNNVTFIQQDARAADLSRGTVFYLYTPFSGTVLRATLDSLRREAGSREIRVCTFGPCTPIVAEEKWLKVNTTPKVDQIAVFSSRN